MELKARRVHGNQFTAEDTIELKFTYTGDLLSCVQHIEKVSGVDVTHGGGASADTPLHYKAKAVDADSDGIIDYSSSMMQIVQASKGTSVIKIVANSILKSEVDAWETAHASWVTDYCTDTSLADGFVQRVVADGAPTEPAYPSAKEEKSGNITLVWGDDTFV